eukprot:m.237420 g.237420  ORF g.237420 m.237420 type:complete len:229 (+) comp15793_c0_seq1:166-852(+)
MAPSTSTPLFLAASAPEGTQTELMFEAKYYGRCPEIDPHAEAPNLDTAVEIMAARKADGSVVRCTLTFNEHGATVSRRKSKRTEASWASAHMATCATAEHPNSKSRRIGLLKIREPETGELCWHLFKYYFHKRDNMTECFRFVVDCGLRELGRSYASQVAVHSEPSQDYTAAPAWAAPVPPSYDEATTEAALEAADLAAGADRLMDLCDDVDDNDVSMVGYLEVTATN